MVSLLTSNSLDCENRKFTKKVKVKASTDDDEPTLEKSTDTDYCLHCGAKLTPGEDFCTNCGQKRNNIK